MGAAHIRRPPKKQKGDGKMTDHKSLKMHQEARRITEKEQIETILSEACVATVCFHDEPYPYSVAMNYGYEWKDSLFFYFHMGIEGHRIELIRKNPLVSLSIFQWLDRHGYHSYKNETHDYRSVHAYGKAEIVGPDQEEEFLHGLSLLQMNNHRPAVKKLTEVMKNELFILKITVDFVTAKAQYPLDEPEEAKIPENF